MESLNGTDLFEWDFFQQYLKNVILHGGYTGFVTDANSDMNTTQMIEPLVLGFLRSFFCMDHMKKSWCLTTVDDSSEEVLTIWMCMLKQN